MDPYEDYILDLPALVRPHRRGRITRPMLNSELAFGML
jgi:hypothetical protein